MEGEGSKAGLIALTEANAFDMIDAWPGQPPAREPQRSRIGQIDDLLRQP